MVILWNLWTSSRNCCSVSSTENDINTWLGKPWTAIDRLSFIWKLNISERIKRIFFQATVVLILLYRCITWTLTKRIENKLDGNRIRMIRAISNRSWKQHPTKQQLKLFKSDERDLRDTAGEVRANPSATSNGPFWTDMDDQLELIYNSSVPIQDVV